MTLTVKPLKNFTYFWVRSIACPKLTSNYINYTTNVFVPVVWKRILDIMLPVITSSLCESILVKYLFHFSILHPRFASIFYSILLYIFQASLLHESILVESLVYFSILHPCFTSLFSRVSCLFFNPTYTLAWWVYFSWVELNRTHTGRYIVTFYLLTNSCWLNKYFT